MSSHHIVRDNQEPALLVLDASYIPFTIIEELLEWSPFIIIHESQIDLFLQRGIKIDAVVFEENLSEQISEKIKDQIPIHLISYQSENCWNKALMFLQNRNHGHVNIITDDIELLTSLKLQENPKNISVFHRNVRWSLVRSGYFEKWIANNEIFLLHGGEQITLYPNSENRIKIERRDRFWVGEKI